MHRPTKAGIRLFLLSFCLTLVAMATAWGFVVVNRHMQEMGMAPQPQPTASVLSRLDYSLPAFDIAGLEMLRRKADCLTLPRSARLMLKLYALLGLALEAGVFSV
jgi:hypothetical protein